MAGADIFLMPSLYEPCGLTQMRAQRYGSPPVVRRVGGLADTVDDGLTGFSFDAYTPMAFEDAGLRALAAYADSDEVAGHDAARHGAGLRLGARGATPTSTCTGARWRTRRPIGERTCGRSRSRAAHPPSLRPEPRALAPRQRLALRGDARHLPAAAGDPALPRARRACRRPSPSASRRSWRISSRSPVFAAEMEAFFEQRLAACDEAPEALAASGDGHLLPLVSFWRTRLLRLRRLFQELGRDLIGAFALAGGGGPDRDHRLRRDSRVPPAARAGREHSAPARGGARRAPAPLRSCPGRLLVAGVRLSTPRSVASVADGAAGRTPPRHRGAHRRRGPPLLLRGRAHRRSRTSAQHLRRSGGRPDRPRTARGERPGEHSAVALPDVPDRAGTRRGRRGLRARSAHLHAGVEPAPGLSRRRVVPRVPQDALAREGSSSGG